nr:girdin-like [Leptinotarsa decemlineata]
MSMMNEAIKKAIEESSRRILEEIQGARNDLKGAIDSTEKKLLNKINEQTLKIKQLEEENKKLKTEIENLDRTSRKRNIVIFGINKPSTEISADFICSEIGKRVEVNIEKTDISDFYLLGKSRSAPLKIELISYAKKREILGNGNKLKGSPIAISEDLTPAQRNEYKNLRDYRLKLEKSGKYNSCVIKGNKLVIDGKKFSLEEALNFENDEEEEKSTQEEKEEATSNRKSIKKQTEKRIVTRNNKEK